MSLRHASFGSSTRGFSLNPGEIQWCELWLKLEFCKNLYGTMSDYFYSVNISVSCFLLVSTVISRTGLLCRLFLYIILHRGDMENGLGTLSILGNRRKYCNVNNMLIVLHGLIYIVFEDTLSIIQVSDRGGTVISEDFFKKHVKTIAADSAPL